MQRFSNKFVGGYISCVGRGPCRCQPSMDHLACSTEVLQQDVAAVSSMNHCDQVEVSFTDGENFSSTPDVELSITLGENEHPLSTMDHRDQVEVSCTGGVVMETMPLSENLNSTPHVQGSMTLGENLHPELTTEGLQADMLALFFKLVRGLRYAEIGSLMLKIIEKAKEEKDVSQVQNLFVLAFQTRSSSKGKGERLLFYQMLSVLNQHFPSAVLNVVPYVVNYGYWKDLLLLLEFFQQNGTKSDKLENAVWNLFANQLQIDMQEVDKAKETGKTPILSLAAKYAPSENMHFARTLQADKHIQDLVFPGAGAGAKAKYRKMLTLLRSMLHLPENFMCSGRWSQINMQKVPSVCMSRQKKSFLNEGSKVRTAEDRVMCRDNFIQLLGSGQIKLNGAQLFPHVLVENILQEPNASAAVKQIINLQWDTLREDIRSKINPVGLGNLLPVVDVSGSMHGTPMFVAIAMGVLASELGNQRFGNKVITFSETPEWHHCDPADTFFDRVVKMSNMEWGYNTDVYKTMQLIQDDICEKKMLQHDIPNLLFISDMQFDCAESSGNWNLVYKNIQNGFANLGKRLHGVPFQAPQIIFWNVRSNTVGFPATADAEGVILLSGFSPNLFQFVCEDALNDPVDPMEETSQIKNKIDPQEILNKVLADASFLPIRDAVVEMDLFETSTSLPKNIL